MRLGGRLIEATQSDGEELPAMSGSTSANPYRRQNNLLFALIVVLLLLQGVTLLRLGEERRETENLRGQAAEFKQVLSQPVISDRYIGTPITRDHLRIAEDFGYISFDETSGVLVIRGFHSKMWRGPDGVSSELYIPTATGENPGRFLFDPTNGTISNSGIYRLRQ